MKTVPLTRGYVALVDDADYPRVSPFSWSARVEKRGSHVRVYAIRSVRVDGIKRTVQMHNFILDCPRVDHHDSNGINNQRCNLRASTVAQNAMNMRKAGGKSSRFKGVHWKKLNRKWCVQIKSNQKQIYVGMFRDEADAATAYNFKALELFGEFALLNTPLAVSL